MGRFLSALLGSKLRIAATALVALAVVGGGAVAAGVLGAPTVTGVDNRFADVNETATTIDSTLQVHNPNPVGVQLGGTTVDYAIAMNDVRMASGTKEGVGVETGNSTLPFTTHLRNEQIPAWWVSHLQNGEHTTLAVDASVHSSLLGTGTDAPTVEREVSTDVSSSFDSTETQPIAMDQPLVSDPVLYLNETSGEWGEVTESETPIEMSFTVYNPKSYPITASSIGYDVAMNDVDVGSGASDRELVVPPGETRTIDATTVIDNQKLDEWWVTHLERNQVTDMEIQFYARFDLSATGAGSVRIPLDSVSHEIETDMFGNKNETAGAGSDGAPGNESGTPTDAATETPTEPGAGGTVTDDGDGLLPGESTTDSGTDEPTETPPPTPTPPETSTPTETPTDDDGLLGGVV